MTNEDNKLIAEFMGWDIADPRTFPKTCQQPIYDDCWGDYRFDTSWDWIMPVVERIENYGYEFKIMESRCAVCHNTDHSIAQVIDVDIIGTKIEATYKAVVGIIKLMES